MFHQPMCPSQMPILRNPPTSPPVAVTSAPTTNGNNSSVFLSSPFSPRQIQQPPPEVLAEISRTPPRSIVQVTAYELVHEGEFKYIKDGFKFSVLDSIELNNPILLPDRCPIPSPKIRFNMREIRGFRLIRPAGVRRPPHFSEKKRKPELDPDQPVQLHMTTCLVQTALQLKTFAQIIYDVDACGISLEGENVCRHGKVSWIIIGAKKTLVPLDITSLFQQVPNLWDTLKKSVFENKKLVKIFHDCRPAADYLHHKHDIKLVNVFDTQVADAMMVRNTTGFSPSELKPLADVLQLYNARIPSEEIEYLKKFDEQDFKQNSPWMMRPLPESKYLKYGALKVKHLVPLRDNEIKKMMEKYARAVAAQTEIYNQTDSLFQEQVLQNPFTVPSHLESILDEEPSSSG